MRRRPSPVNSDRPSLLVAAVAAALLLVAPVTARAGGEVPHAHALIQLLIDGADGAIYHHHPAPAANGHTAAAGGHDGDAVAGHASAAVAVHPERGHRSTPDGGEGPPAERFASADHRTTGADDTPTISPLASAAVAALMAALGVAVLPLPSPTGRARRLFSPLPALSGLIPSPEPPPPRPSA